MSEIAISQIQKTFQTHSVYKRSKKYLDIQKMNKLQRQQSIKRRKPTISIQTLDTRVDSSFINNHQLNQEKRIYDINRFKRMSSIQFQESQIDIPVNQQVYDYQRLVSGVKPSPRYFNMDKMRSRQDQNKRLSPKMISLTQRQFQNFSLTKFKPHIAVQFDKNLTREQRNKKLSPKLFPLQNELINPEQIKDRLTYNRASFKCLFDYQKKKQQKAQKQKQEPKAVQMDRINNALAFSSSYKTNGIASFWGMVGKQAAGTMDLRLKKSNQFFYNDPQIKNKKQDYLIAKMKQDSFSKRLNDIHQKRVFIDDKTEMCDVKYFRRVIGRKSAIK